MKKTFDGSYYKHQIGGHTVALIAGIAWDHAFVQVITNQGSYYFNYPLSAYSASSGERLKIGDNLFSKSGVNINIQKKGVSIYGKIKYVELTPIQYDIMGPFKYLPMECRHKIPSLHHRLEGNMTINEKTIDFTGGIGYMEGDSGISFPKNYSWIQCNDFPEKACITVSVAHIPLACFHFQGCICIVYFKDTEYRIATYLGVKILACDENQIILKQGRLRLEIEMDKGTGHKLLAPKKGRMNREIRERIVCGARFRFLKNDQVLFDRKTDKASFEYAPIQF